MNDLSIVTDPRIIKAKQIQKTQDSSDVPLARPQRHSTTSGVDEAPAVKRTWTVPEEGEDGQTHRGGKKHAKGDKKRGKRQAPLGTGVNAIPVG